MSIEAILALLTVAALVCLILGIERALRADTHNIDQRLRRYGARAFMVTDQEQKQAASAQVAQMLSERVEQSISGRSFANTLRTDLARANVKLNAGEFLILQGVASVITGALAFLISSSFFVSLVFALGGWFIPKIWLSRRQAKRIKAFNEQLADTISLLSNSLRSGLSLVQAIEMISRESEPPVSEEFQRVVREIGLGVGPQDALLHLVRRIKSDDLDLLVTAILVQFEVGGNLSRILDSIATTIRERVKLHGEIKTMSAQGRMAGYMLSGMPIGIGGILMLIAPDYIGKLFSPGPWLVLPVCAVMGVVIGGLVINKLVDIEV